MNFGITFISVLSLLAYAIPGFYFTKRGKIKPESASSFATILVAWCSPCLMISSLTSVEYSPDILLNLGVIFVIIACVQLAIIGASSIFLWKKGKEDAKYRIGILASSSGNVGFFGIPLLRILMADQPIAISIATACVISLNIVAYTVGSMIITRDKKYISIKTLFLNPGTIGFVLGLIIFVNQIEVPSQIMTIIRTCGDMCAPLCMIILGIRLATVKLDTFRNIKFHLCIVGVKQIIMPLFILLITLFLPIDQYAKTTLFILGATPVASVTLSFSEMLGQGQQDAAKMLLLGTVLSVITMPIVLLAAAT